MSSRKTASVARHPKQAKPAAPSAAKLEKQITDLQSEVRHLETTATKKHKAAPAKKHKAAPAKKHKAAAKHGGTKRGLALGDGIACCAAEALAAALRLAGQRVTDDDVLELHLAAGGTVTGGVSIAEALAAAADRGLAGVRPARIHAIGRNLEFGLAEFKVPVICGVALPGGPHAITLDPRAGGAWSWGELYPLGQLVPGRVDEAWQVTWS